MEPEKERPETEEEAFEMLMKGKLGIKRPTIEPMPEYERKKILREFEASQKMFGEIELEREELIREEKQITELDRILKRLKGKEVKVLDSKINAINSFAPFCHATHDSLARKIDKIGLLPRESLCEVIGEEGLWEEAGCPSKEDRVYLASVSQHVGSCFSSLQNAYAQFEELPHQAWEDGVFYVLDEIPPDYEDDLVIDEDCLLLDKTCATPMDSLKAIGSLGIKRRIPREMFKKMTPREFFKFLQKFEISDLPKTWGEFMEGNILERGSKEDVEWMREHNPKLFED